jgi:Flp pilus assembly pilin Flp
VTETLKQFMSDEAGADLIEYALLAGLLSMACFLALSGVGTGLTTFFGSVSAKMAAIVP